MPVIDHERRGQAQQRLDRQKCHLPATRHGAAGQQCPELLLGVADRQI
jgi:hypothetical protein